MITIAHPEQSSDELKISVFFFWVEKSALSGVPSNLSKAASHLTFTLLQRIFAIMTHINNINFGLIIYASLRTFAPNILSVQNKVYGVKTARMPVRENPNENTKGKKTQRLNTKIITLPLLLKARLAKAIRPCF